jgi:chemotaxis protein methyltransferase CheR
MNSLLSRDDRRLTLTTFEAIRRTLNRYAGLWFSLDMRTTVERRLRERLNVLGTDNFEDYAARIEQDQAELEEAAEVCTVNETYAFRGMRQLVAFRDGIVPRFAAKDRITVWSAGCSSGEEAYTLAAILLGSGRISPERVKVFGTDISRRCIALARRGTYSLSSFREDPYDQQQLNYDHFFTPHADGSRTVTPELKNVCHFKHANLLDTAIGGFIDVVFCRNVLIHMDERSRMRVVLGFFERMSPGGYLILGHSESLLNESVPFVVEEICDEIVYRKPEITSGGSQ